MKFIRKEANENPAINIPELIKILFPKPNLSIRSLRESIITRIKNNPKNNPKMVPSTYCSGDNILIVISFSKFGSNPEIVRKILTELIKMKLSKTRVVTQYRIMNILVRSFLLESFI